jgi:hypothetical protein
MGVPVFPGDEMLKESVTQSPRADPRKYKKKVICIFNSFNIEIKLIVDHLTQRN